MVLKENASIQDITWVEAHTLEFPELRIELQPQRFYPLGKTLAHVLGYVGEISPKQLEKEEFKDKYRPGDIIGKGGLEQYYDEFLRGKDGYRKVIVDSRGRIQTEVDVVPPQSGQDLVTTIDLDLQLAAEAQLEATPTKRGTIISMDPNNGELLVMASLPSFDPNIFVQGSSTPEGRKQIAAYWQDESRPLYNRAIQGRYPPGSTWKIPESVSALQQGVITVKDSHIACGGGLMIGNKFTRCMGNHGTPAARLCNYKIVRRLLLSSGRENRYRRFYKNGLKCLNMTSVRELICRMKKSVKHRKAGVHRSKNAKAVGKIFAVFTPESDKTRSSLRRSR